MYFVMGATATGKTAYAAELAKKVNGEIISCDSMQIYKFLDIGTAKTSADETRGVPHHMIDIITPDTPFSVAEYKAAALKCADGIKQRGRTPIFAGGTGLYANAVLFDYGFGSAKKSIRDMEKPLIEAKVIVLEADRAALYAKIERRVDLMFEKGLEDEVKRLLDAGFTFEMPGMKGIGYREFAPYFAGDAKLGEVIESIKKNSRAYAKRQVTWFRSWNFAERIYL